jgi:hypothetical protein
MLPPALLVQLPNSGRQLAPQWSTLLPQKPLDEQQSPKLEPAQTFPDPLGPQVPALETFPVSLQVPNRDWQPAPQCAAEEPQKPLDEQQLPYAVPVQLNFLDPPQVPSGDELPGPGAGVLQLP